MTKTGQNKKPKSKTESAFQKKVIDLIARKGGYPIKIHISAFQNKQGNPDVVCCYQGRFVAFELKTEDGEAAVLQKFRIKQIKRAGGIAIISDSLAEIEETLDEIFGVQQGGESRK